MRLCPVQPVKELLPKAMALGQTDIFLKWLESSGWIWYYDTAKLTE